MNQHVRKPPGSEVEMRAEPWLERVDSFLAEGHYKQALAVLIPRVKAGLPDIKTLDRTAMSYYQLGDVQTALSLIQVMVKQWPDVAAGWAKLAAMQQTAGNIEAAAGNFKTALKLDPYLIRALSALNGLEPFSRNGQKYKRLKKLAQEKTLPPMDQALVHNTIGLIEKRHGKYSVAFNCFARSKASLGARFHSEALQSAIDGQIQQFKPALSETSDPAGPKVIFVCGMPRSGTTWAEAILQRHSAVETIGESKALSRTLREVRKYTAEVGRGTDVWSWAGSLEEQEIEVFRKMYFQLALNGQNKGPVLIDKMPMNCRDMALAQVLLPGCKFVFLSRHPLDVGLSNFSICFQEVMAFTCRLDWLGCMTREVYRSALDYQSKLGTQMRVQSYEALVTDPENQIPVLLQQCGLDWEDACLAPEGNKSVVNTASLLQVREKINIKGLNKWKPFEKQLQPLVEALGGQEWIENWERWDKNAALTGRFETGPVI
ncbi:sulfotransferase [Leisingera sp. M527]|uniref:sulfotransferase family protein n=1 Tax=Leisingera sp. M527 TaxID=2867014 RepID=UPI0021A7101C|nr:tetratricopeptide repeat-containing sulfotransferase family protein [Leisingera sp. M527]UWQ34874.1 sulfotransferase [Leisingera sp. M527]